MRTRLQRTAVYAVASLGVLALLTVLPHYRLKRAVAAYRQELRAKGEKLSIEELIPPPVPAESNGVIEFNAAIARLPRVNPDSQPSLMRYVGPGRARVAWRQAELPNHRGTNTWPEIETVVDSGRDALAALQAALAKPAFQYDLDYSRGFDSLKMTHLVSLKASANALATALVADLHRNQRESAWASMRALSALVAHNDREPVIISHLVRAAMLHIGVNASWEALQYSSWTESQLAEWQALWAGMDVVAPTEAMFAMERALGEPTFEHMRQSRDAFMSALTWNPTGTPNAPISLDEGLGEALRELHNRTTRYLAWKWFDSYEEELLSIKGWQVMIETARRAQAEPSFQPTKKFLEASLDELKACNSNMVEHSVTLSGCLDPHYFSRLITAESLRRLTITAIALQRYRLRHGQYPVGLKSLAPEFLPAVPLDRMDGQPLRYKLKPDGSFLLYSVGEDGVDDDGDPGPTKADDYMPRHWTGRDWVWPSPATDEEVAEAERKKR